MWEALGIALIVFGLIALWMPRPKFKVGDHVKVVSLGMVTYGQHGIVTAVVRGERHYYLYETSIGTHADTDLERGASPDEDAYQNRDNYGHV